MLYPEDSLTFACGNECQQVCSVSYCEVVMEGSPNGRVGTCNTRCRGWGAEGAGRYEGCVSCSPLWV